MAPKGTENNKFVFSKALITYNYEKSSLEVFLCEYARSSFNNL